MLTGEKKDDPLAMYAGDIMTVSILTLIYHLLSLMFYYIYLIFTCLVSRYRNKKSEKSQVNF